MQNAGGISTFLVFCVAGIKFSPSLGDYLQGIASLGSLHHCDFTLASLFAQLPTFSVWLNLTTVLSNSCLSASPIKKLFYKPSLPASYLTTRTYHFQLWQSIFVPVKFVVRSTMKDDLTELHPSKLDFLFLVLQTCFKDVRFRYIWKFLASSTLCWSILPKV